MGEGSRSRSGSLRSTISTPRVWRLPLFSDQQGRDATVAYARAAFGLLSTLLFWIGAWNLLSEGKVQRRNHTDEFGVLPHTWLRTSAYMTVGLVVLALCDALYANAGLSGNYFAAWPLTQAGNRVVRVLAFFVQVTLALCASAVFWVGAYDMVDYSEHQTFLRDVVLVLGGFVVLFGTRTLFHMSYIYPDNDEDPCPTVESTLRVHAIGTVRAVASMVGQNMLWVGSYNMMETHGPTIIWREATYALGGLLLLHLTGAFVANSWIDTEYVEVRPQRASIQFYVRCVLAIAGQLLWVNAAWTIIDSYTLADTKWRNVGFLLAGVLFLFLNGAADGNAGVYPPYDEEEEDKDGEMCDETHFLLVDGRLNPNNPPVLTINGP
eukprot:m.73812 g.73812  ORF g.73812 m.73812 type:complete len:379 (+) comp14387_c0_seq2:1441-2577(+)